jgi:hypothetical protein
VKVDPYNDGVVHETFLASAVSHFRQRRMGMPRTAMK